MAAFSMEAACRAVLGRRLQSVWRIAEVSERQYHRCPATARLHRLRATGTHQLLVFTNARHQSTVTTAASQIPVVSEAQLPPPPPPLPAPEAILPPPVAEVAPTVTETLGQVEQSLSELGLGGYSPVGLVQDFLELLHVNVGLPWWGAIVTGTVLARIMVFPLIVKGQREAAKLNNHMPQITALTTRMNEAKQSGNKYEFSKTYSDLTLYQKKHDVNPLRGFLVPLVQAPVFISFFVALRQMSYLPVPSMQTGGLWWFADLTVADPYYILPLVVTSSMWAVLELGAESGVNNPNLRIMKTVFRIMPLVILPLTINFPTAVFTYWVTSNFFSIAQVAFLRIPAVRKKLRIPEHIKHDASVLPQQEGFIKSLKNGWKNAQLAQDLEQREHKIKHHLDIAAKGPLRQTFAQNPLQQREKTPVSPRKPKTKPWQDTIG
ncbi:mitochondrial inner membrane protein OXA1L [Bufo bufo]|uniref:mitochondrial inner membrane protein OXA1L n=1 Tax=Bufo bufo TaxID=8384 RepID=UPI001ABDB8AD|nr:mitochondrial inner membrane protein OXA1L [Bufo bufo]